MTRHYPLSSEFRSYPFLTPEEFAEVCHHLDRRYSQATLGPVRRQWKMRVCMALNTTAAFTLGPEYGTYLQIIRPLEGELDDGDLSRYLNGFSFGDDPREIEMDRDGDRDGELMEAEEADQVGESYQIPYTHPMAMIRKEISHYLPRTRLSCPNHWTPSEPATSGMRSIFTRHTRPPACGSACTTCRPTSSH